jgi:hypothetical protein
MSREQQRRFERVVKGDFVADMERGQFRPGLRVKRVHVAPAGVFEMTWAPDGRATWEYGDEQRPDTPHVVWRRVGGHEIFDPGPP